VYKKKDGGIIILNEGQEGGKKDAEGLGQAPKSTERLKEKAASKRQKLMKGLGNKGSKTLLGGPW